MKQKFKIAAVGSLLFTITATSCKEDNKKAETTEVQTTQSTSASETVDTTARQQKSIGDNSQNSLDWGGTYTGKLSDGTDITLNLQYENTYSRTVTKGGTKVQDSGKIEWSNNGSTITLLDKDKTKFNVGENIILPIGKDGNRLDEKFTLKKVN